MAKHSRRRVRKSGTTVALAGGAAATAAVITIGVAAPANAAAVPVNPVTTPALSQSTLPGAFEAPATVAEGLAGSGLRLAQAVALQPVNVLALADAIAKGDRQAVFEMFQNAVDAPLWIADPTITAAEHVLPAPLGGDTGLIKEFRDNVLWQLTEVINAAVKPVIVGQQQVSGLTQSAANSAAGGVEGFANIVAGLAKSGQNFAEGVVLAPISLVLLGAAVAQGDEKTADYIVQQIIDEPLWVAKPTFDAFKTLPAPIGGPGGFADDAFLRAYDIREAVRRAILGSDKTLPPPNNSASTVTLSRDATPTAASLSSVNQQGPSKLTEVSSPPATPARKGPLLNVIRGADNSPTATRPGTSADTKADKPVANVQNQLRSATENAQSQLKNAATNTIKRVTDTIGNIGKHRASESSSSPGAGSS